MTVQPDPLQQNSGSHLPVPKAEQTRHAKVAVSEFEEVAAAELPTRDEEEVKLPEIHFTDVLCIGPLMANGVYQFFGRGIFPLLVGSHPVLLLAIRASLPALIAAGALVRSGHLPLLVALLVPIPYLFFDDPFYYWAGRRYGDRLSNYLVEQDPRWEKRIARGNRIMERWGAWAIIVCNQPYVPVPVSVLYFIAGDSRMSIPIFVLSDLFGIFIAAATFVALGYFLGSRAQAVVDVISHYGGYIAIATIVLLLIYVVFSTRRTMQRMRDRQNPPKQ